VRLLTTTCSIDATRIDAADGSQLAGQAAYDVRKAWGETVVRPVVFEPAG